MRSLNYNFAIDPKVMLVIYFRNVNLRAQILAQILFPSWLVVSYSIILGYLERRVISPASRGVSFRGGMYVRTLSSPISRTNRFNQAAFVVTAGWSIRRELDQVPQQQAAGVELFRQELGGNFTLNLHLESYLS